MLAYLPHPIATGYPSPYGMTRSRGPSSSCPEHYIPSPISYDDYTHHSRLEELRRAEASIQAAIAEEETRRRRQFEQRVAFGLAVRQAQQQAEELERRRRRQQAEEEAAARLAVAAAIAHRAELAREQERARQVALALRQAQEQEQYRRRLEVARQQQQRRLRQQLEARRQRARQTEEVAPALVQLVLDIFAASQPEDEQVSTKEVDAREAQLDTHPSTAPATTDAPATVASSPVKEVAVPTAMSESPVALNDSSASLEEAAKILQRRFRRHAARRSALDQLSALATDLVSRRRAFEAPAELHFQSSPVSDDTAATAVPPPPPSPPLAFDKSNKAFLAYEDFLVSLLSKIDAVDSNGDKVVQRARKELVRQVEAELSRLDELKQQEWERQSGASSRAGSEVEEVEDEDHKADSKTVLEAQENSTADSVSDVNAPPAVENNENLSAALDEHGPVETATGAVVETPTEAGPIPSTHSTEPSTTSDADIATPSTDAVDQVSTSDVTPAASGNDEAVPVPSLLQSDEALAALDSDGGESSGDEELDVVINEVMKRAKALGEQVEALERAEDHDDGAASEQDKKEQQEAAKPGSAALDSSSDSAQTTSAESAALVAEAITELTDSAAEASVEDDASPSAQEPPAESTEAPKDVPVVKEDAVSEAGTEDFEVV
ncbi:hypothetical protein JCM3774_002663 [Rhodotorula dairenensis]